MTEKISISYKDAGVDTSEGARAVELMKSHVLRTKTAGVLDGLGGFAGLFIPNLNGIKEPVLVSGVDGVGTKLKLAFLTDRHDTVGVDCVAMCVNDIICCGAKPLFFLDYIACGKNVPERIENIVAGICEGCVQSGSALIGGETAEMPGFYKENEYDLAGFAVGVVDKEKILDKHRIKEGDVLIALPSSGVHSNGFSLIRKVFGLDNEGAERRLTEKTSSGKTLGETLLEPTKIYVKPVSALSEEVDILSLAHITGGGFYENIPRILPSGLSTRIDRTTIKIPEIFGLIAEEGKIPEDDMFATFNMGVGMIAVVKSRDENKAVEVLNREGIPAYRMGEIISGGEGIRIC